jgi:hypothetical protein
VPLPTLKLHWDKPEDVMNKLMIAAVIAGGLLLMNAPEAAAHQEVRNVHKSHAYTPIEVRRPARMPGWLKRNKAFRHWYARTSLRRDHRLAWHQLFEIYSWEHRWGRGFYRSDNYWRDYYAHRHDERHFDRDDHRGGRKHRHRH